MRSGGYAPIEDYAILGDGRTAALVSRDGSVDWLCVPDFESPPVFGRLLDARRGGFWSVAPVGEFEVERRYREGTNVLETTFRTASGSARVTDAMTLDDPATLTPLRELVRLVEGIDGRVELEWRVEPRFGFELRRPRIVRRAGRFVATVGATALAVDAWGAGDAAVRDGGVGGRFTVAPGERVTFAVALAHGEPLVLPARADVERRLDDSSAFWERWSSRIDYEGAWGDLVVRSALALKLLVFAPSGAIVAAPTTSLPERIGGGRNWDYRYTWVRDAALTLTALQGLGYDQEVRAFLWWLSHATALTHPEVRVMYRLSGGAHLDERERRGLDGYRGSRPVRVGNDAHRQVQLDVYGPMLDAIWHARETTPLDATGARHLASVADWIAEHWADPDAGIWEVRRTPTHFIQSKAMCWVALDRACALAEAGFLPDRAARWHAAATAIRAFVDERGWDARRGTYVRASDMREADASLLTLVLFGYDDAGSARAAGKIAAVERELREGPLVYRYRRDDGIDGDEGAFLTCSFWLAAALAKTGRVDAASALMDELARLANDVGLYSEEIAPGGSFLGNFPQALTHLALIDAALAIRDAEAAA